MSLKALSTAIAQNNVSTNGQTTPSNIGPTSNQFLCKRVISSAFTAIGYRYATKTLRMIFKTGVIRDYYPVPPYIFQNLLKSESIGTSYHIGLKNHFPSAKICTEQASAFLAAFEQAEKTHLIPVNP